MSINAAYRATQDARRAETAPEPEEAPAQSFEPVPVNPCPYCHRQSPAIDHNGSGNVYFVRCDGCQMTGPAAGDEADAAEKWNSLPPREVTR